LKGAADCIRQAQVNQFHSCYSFNASIEATRMGERLESNKQRVLIVPILHGGQLDPICDNPYNVSEIDQNDDSEIDRFFTQEYLPYYELIKQAMIQECPSGESRYYFGESSGCSRLYGVHISSFEQNDALAIASAMRVLDLIKRESCFVADVKFEYDGREFDGTVAYIARSGKCLIFPPPLASMFADVFPA
jgi:hypothetical protein